MASSLQNGYLCFVRFHCTVHTVHGIAIPMRGLFPETKHPIYVVSKSRHHDSINAKYPSPELIVPVNFLMSRHSVTGDFGKLCSEVLLIAKSQVIQNTQTERIDQTHLLNLLRKTSVLPHGNGIAGRGKLPLVHFIPPSAYPAAKRVAMELSMTVPVSPAGEGEGP